MCFFRYHAPLIIALTFFLCIGTWFVLLLIDPRFEPYDCIYNMSEQVHCNQMVGDIYQYYSLAQNEGPEQWLKPFLGLFSEGSSGDYVLFRATGLTNLWIYVLIATGLYVMPSAPLFFTFLVQIVFVIYYYRNIEILGKHFGVQNRAVLQWLCLFQPFFISVATSPGKEFWSVILVVAMARYLIEKKYARYFAVVIWATCVRDVNLLVGGFLFLAYVWRVRPILILIAISLLIPLADQIFPAFYEFRTLLSTWIGNNAHQGQTGAEFYMALAILEHYPFGFLLGMPFMFIINVIAPLFSPTAWHVAAEYSSFAVANILWSISGIMILVYIVLTRSYRNIVSSPVWPCVIAVASTSSLALITQPRYYLPIWPFLVILALSPKDAYQMLMWKGLELERSSAVSASE